MLDLETIESQILIHLIARAEKTLADHKIYGTLSGDALCIFEGIVEKMHDELRLVLEEMMHLPFRSAGEHGSGQ